MPKQIALLIGSPHGELKKVKKDLETTTAPLKNRGFEIEQCCDEQATRDGIYKACNSIIEKSAEGDAVVVYYSGHAGLAKATAPRLESQAGRPWRFQFIVPTDFDNTTDDNFLGIVDVELSHLLSALTVKTRNVTTILDCCHSGRMARSAVRKDDPQTLCRGNTAASRIRRIQVRRRLDLSARAMSRSSVSNPPQSRCLRQPKLWHLLTQGHHMLLIVVFDHATGDLSGTD